MGMPTAEADFFCGIFAAWMRATEEGQAFLTRTDEYKDILA
jgi:hypothetical protein